MVSFTQVFVTLSAAGLILGRQELVQISRAVGKGVGTLVGFLQGFRIKLEQASKDSGIYELQEDVRKGLDELSTVRSELTMTTQRRFTGHTVWKGTQTPQASSGVSGAVGIAAAIATAESATLPSTRSRASEQMARMILAQEQLSSDRFFNPRIERKSSGADIVSSAISESILSGYLVANQNELLNTAAPASVELPKSGKPQDSS